MQYYTISDLERPKDPHLVKQSFEYQDEITF